MIKRFGVGILVTLLVTLAGFGVGFGVGCGAASGQTTQPIFNSAKNVQARYTWKSVQIVGGGFVDGVIFHPTAAGGRVDRGGSRAS